MSRLATRIFVVTPSYNAAGFLEQTLASVAGQAGDFEVFHHVQDGGSQDGTVELLQRWAQRAAYGLIPRFCKSYRFSWTSEPDHGMYDAIAKGFVRFDAAPRDWMTWLNADDLLMPGAFALLDEIDANEDLEAVNWVTGAAALMDRGVIRMIVKKPSSRAVIASGLCEGRTWDFVQAEGTFFRAGLWQSVDIERDFTSFKFAGDWNLWRCFAADEELYQVDIPLGVFVKREGQLSQAERSAYNQEVDNIVSPGRRAAILRRLVTTPPDRRVLAHNFKAGHLEVRDERLKNHADFWFDKCEFIKSGLDREAGDSPGVIAHDQDWQYPAITEQHAFHQVSSLIGTMPGVTYFAFPWATLIDRINNKSDRVDELVDALRVLARETMSAEYVFTVCQHIHLDRLAPFMREAGVTDVFWTHAERGRTVLEGDPPIRIHPFPLYPVQFPELSPRFTDCDRPILFSFVGARSNQWYLTKVRDWILDELAGDPRGLVRGRESWHYNTVVYEHQIRQSKSDKDTLIDNQASAEFRDVLEKSLFSLCPSGSGPNSIRLWESIGAGSIPVILADSWLPPGNEALWREAAIFVPETPEAVRALPGQLEAMARDAALLERKRHAMHQLWQIYGPQTFVADIHARAMNYSNRRHAETVAPRASGGSAPKPLKVHAFGRHAHRTPLAYAAYKPFYRGAIDFVADAEKADLLVVGFDADLLADSRTILALLDANPDLKLVVLSEEPLWDMIWSTGFQSRETTISLAGRSVPLVVLNHVTSAIYDFAHIPYYVSTSDEFIARYARMFARNREMGVETLLERWRKAKIPAAFYSERRKDSQYARVFPELEIEGLCNYRTDLAEAYSDPAAVKVGKGWGEAGPRQVLPDWHLDKLAALDGRTRIVSALENTLVGNYVTEKVFDAYAVGAIPLYYAGSRHRLFDLVDEGGLINLCGLDPADGAELARTFEPDRAFADRYLNTQARLAERFRQTDQIFEERARVASEVIAELRNVAGG